MGRRTTRRRRALRARHRWSPEEAERKLAEAEATRTAAEEARRVVEEDARSAAEAAAKRTAEEEATRAAEEDARQATEEATRAQRAAEEAARLADAKLTAEAEARRAADEKRTAEEDAAMSAASAPTGGRVHLPLATALKLKDFAEAAVTKLRREGFTKATAASELPERKVEDLFDRADAAGLLDSIECIPGLLFYLDAFLRKPSLPHKPHEPRPGLADPTPGSRARSSREGRSPPRRSTRR